MIGDPNKLKSELLVYMTCLSCPYCGNLDSFEEKSWNPSTVKCRICGIYRMYPRMNLEGMHAFPKLYGRAIYSKELQALTRPYKFANEIRALKSAYSLKLNGCKVLDVGCGNGSFMSALKRNGAIPTGIEPVPDLVSLGLRRGLDLRMGFFEYSSVPLDSAKDRFDLVCFRESIYYMPSLRETLQLLRTYLKIGGGLYIKCHVPTSPFYHFTSNFALRYGYHVQGVPTRHAIVRILEKEGYEVLRTSYFGIGVAHALSQLTEGSIPKGISYITDTIASEVLDPLASTIDWGDSLFVFARRRPS